MKNIKGVIVLASALTAGCAHSVKMVSGNTDYSVSNFEQEDAQRYSFKTCEEARESANFIETGTHKTAVTSGVSNSPEYIAWARAVRDDVCKTEMERVVAEKASKRAEQEANDRAVRDHAIKQAQARKERVDEEARTGRCNDKTIEHLRGVLGEAPRVLQADSRDATLWTALGHRFEVVTSEPIALTLDAGIGGELHIFAVGYEEPTLTVSDGQGYDVKQRSPLKTLFQMGFGLQATGVKTRANINERLTAKVTGRGCVLLLMMHKM